jgi:hypothetical protein
MSVIAFVLFAASPAFSQTIRHCVHLQAGSDLRVFEARVRVRAAPTLDAAQFGVALINEKVKILEKTTVLYESEGVSAYWYKILWAGKEGFVWGALIAHAAYDGDYNGDGKKETVLVRMEVDDEGDAYYWPEYMVEYKASYRLAIHSTMLSENPFGAASYDESLNSFETILLGFPNGITLFVVCYAFGDGPGWSKRGAAYYLRGNALVRLFEIDEGGYDDNEFAEYTKQTVVGPAKNGTLGTLIVETSKITRTAGVQTVRIVSVLAFSFVDGAFVQWLPNPNPTTDPL